MIDYLDRLASAEPTPGGGSAAMMSAAMSLALCAMVARIRERRPQDAARARQIALKADSMRIGALQQAQRDEQAFDNVMAAKDPAEKQRALIGAASEPLEGARQSLEALRLVSDTLSISGKNLASDVGSAAEFAHAALLACGYNVRVNHRYIDDAQIAARQRAQLERYEREGAALIAAIRKWVSEALVKR